MNRLLLAASLSLLAAPASRSDLTFPRDHGSHPDAAIEWWYWTGHLRDPAGRELGFQLTFFRVGELHLAHFAWTDVARARFSYDEKAHLALPGIASAAADRLDIVNEDWSAVETRQGRHRLHAAGPGWELTLELTPAKPPVLHGAVGVVRKGAGGGDYSRYVSLPRLAASGRARRDGKSAGVTGTAWFDHEWGPGGLPEDVAGWDWFAAQLSDGSELMLYRLRGRSGAASPFSSGTFVPSRGEAVPIRWSEVRLRETRTWSSRRSGAVYPAGWEIAVLPLDLRLSIEPLVADQELVTARSTGVTYWEGACRVEGSRGSARVTGRAYAELTGYAGRDVPGFAAPSAPATPRVRASGSRAAYSSPAPSPWSRASRGSSSRPSGSDRRRKSAP